MNALKKAQEEKSGNSGFEMEKLLQEKELSQLFTSFLIATFSHFFEIFHFSDFGVNALS